METPESELQRLRPKVRFKVCHHLGYYCPDIEDVVQETLLRFVVAMREDKLRSADAAGAFLNGICRNVINEYRRKLQHEGPMPETAPDPADDRMPEIERLEIRQAIQQGMERLADRDRRILTAFYIEEKSKEQILKEHGLSDEAFRVVLSRAKQRFREIYWRYCNK
jgi:RNA polymerase sigma-70 factor (ECF subfamily)